LNTPTPLVRTPEGFFFFLHLITERRLQKNKKEVRNIVGGKTKQSNKTFHSLKKLFLFFSEP